ncbi:MAG: M20 family metallo-hydrolase [Elusimicrobiota bacterium]|jgi:succinyl-diaminopimelate desuccinylase|nr:M20 family metallo-hydrolase [Elusimicrobiota bacterium]
MEKLFKTIEGFRDYVLDLETNMTNKPAISPLSGGKGEYEKSVYIESELKKLKFDELFRIDAPDATAEKGIRPNIIAKYYGEDKSKTLWFMMHMDVVPEGDISLWKTKPFELTLDADKDTIYGRGVEDNQQAIAAAMACARAIMESGKRPPVNMGLMILADEEVGSDKGLIYLVNNNKELFGKGDSFIVQDSGSPEGNEVEIAEKSLLWLQLTTTGKQAHGSMPNTGNNAFYAASHLAIRLSDGLRAKFNKQDTLFNPPVSTFEPTKKEANVPNVNTVPGVDVFCMDCRLLPSYKAEDFEAEVKRIIKTVEDDFKVSIEFEYLQKLTSKATPIDAELVKAYSEGIEKVNNVKAKIIGIGGGTFAAHIRNMDMPAVVGGKIYGMPHVPNEKASLKFILDDAKLLAYTLMNFK